jgi:hypothetical protein
VLLSSFGECVLSLLLDLLEMCAGNMVNLKSAACWRVESGYIQGK